MSTWVDWAGKRKGRERAEAFLERAAELIASTCARTLEGDVTAVAGEDGEPLLLAPLHPAAEPLSIRAKKGGAIEVWAKTSGAGPGYHRYVESVLRLIGAQLGVSWQGVSETSRAEAEREMLAWLAASAEQCLAALDDGATQLALSMPTDPMFLNDSALTTQLGPRDRAWLERAARSPEKAIDVFPWWADGTGAEERLGRAMCLLWSEVAFRPPLHEGERHTLARVAELLELAHREMPDLDYPYRAWSEVLSLLEAKGELAATVAERARSSPAEGAAVGYRRGQMLVRPFGSWELELPGSMSVAYEDDGEAFSAREPGRAVRLSVYSVPDGSASMDELLAVGREPEAQAKKRATPPASKRRPSASALASGLLEHEDRGAKGWARVSESGGGGRMLEGHTASAGALAVCTVAFERPGDRAWAVSTWKSLRPRG